MQFSDELFIPEDPSRLQEQEFKVKGRKLPNLELNVYAEDEDSDKIFDFTWEVVSFTELQMTIQLSFVKSYEVTENR